MPAKIRSEGIFICVFKNQTPIVSPKRTVNPAKSKWMDIVIPKNLRSVNISPFPIQQG